MRSRDFAPYPGAVSKVVALEPQRSLRRFAVRCGLGAEVPVGVTRDRSPG